ncbi:Hypothetical predicted protein [Octopus vulgaris]|uniref:Uncharacterized protein n=1 Tax=Octopus vulgaris TaxID=6645 RepID=A0AA36FCA9_OCTVU|nr:Hypothetical predicted protein [Octopus vulgaris]
MGCRTILPNMEKLSHCGPLPITSSNVGLDYGNRTIEALLKMSSDTDDDEDQSFEQSKVGDTRNKNLLCPSESTPMPPVILHSQTTNYKLYCSPMSQSSASNMVQSPTNQPVSLKTHGILSPPMSSSLSSSLSSVSSWPKKSTKYSKEDSFTKFISDKRQTCSSDEQRKPIEVNVTTPRLEKRPTYANLSSIHRTEANDEGNAEPLSTSSLSSLTDGYPAFTGDTSDCPYGQNYNKPRGLRKFEYHSHYIKQCRIEKTACTKKVWGDHQSDSKLSLAKENSSKSSSHCHKGLSPFSPISNISKDNQMKPEGAKPKVHRQVAKRNHDKRANNNNSSSNRRHRGMLEHRRSRSHNKENTDLSDFEQSSNKHFFEREFICSSRDTPHISKDSGLGACRKSYQSPQIASLANSPALTVAGASTDPTESNEIKRNRQPPTT